MGRGRVPPAASAGAGRNSRLSDLQRELAQELRAHGIRATGPRLAILAHLRSDFSHPTPEAVFQGLRGSHASLSLSTVYQTLETLLQAGLCRRIATRTSRLRVDGTADDHDHAVCRSCGAVLDLPRNGSFAPPAPRGLPNGTEVIGFRIEYEIVCRNCGRHVAADRGVRRPGAKASGAARPEGAIKPEIKARKPRRLT